MLNSFLPWWTGALHGSKIETIHFFSIWKLFQIIADYQMQNSVVVKNNLATWVQFSAHARANQAGHPAGVDKCVNSWLGWRLDIKFIKHFLPVQYSQNEGLVTWDVSLAASEQRKIHLFFFFRKRHFSSVHSRLVFALPSLFAFVYVLFWLLFNRIMIICISFCIFAPPALTSC